VYLALMSLDAPGKESQEVDHARGIRCIAGVSKIAYATATVIRLQWRHGPQRITVSARFVDRERIVIMDSDSVHGIDRRRLVKWGGLAAAGVVAAGAPLVGAGIGHAGSAPAGPSGRDRIPPDTRPGGAYDRYVARLAVEGKFSGVVLLSYRGRTVLSRSYGMADKEKGIRNHEGVAFNLSSGSQPFLA
jgi:hypothetical protein